MTDGNPVSSGAEPAVGQGTGPANGSVGGQPVDPRAVLAALRNVVLDAAEDHDLARRLIAAQTAVQIHFTDAPLSLLLRLDRDPIEVIEGESESAELHVFATSADMHRVFAGEAHLPVLILRGQASYNGPVRKFLRVLPIVRRMSAAYQAHHGDEESRAAGSGSLPTTMITDPRQDPGSSGL